METSKLRYGENPHQTAELQITDPNVGWGKCEILQGKELSYNNIADADAAWRLISDLDTLSFSYFDSNNASTSTLLDVKKVEVSMTLATSVLRKRQSYDFRSARFVLRNRPAG